MWLIRIRLSRVRFGKIWLCKIWLPEYCLADSHSVKYSLLEYGFTECLGRTCLRHMGSTGIKLSGKWLNIARKEFLHNPSPSSVSYL